MGMKKIPLRQCIGCGAMKNKKELIRVIKTPEDTICQSSECLKKAIKNKGLERSLKVNIPQEVYEQLTKEMESIDKKG